MALRVVGAGLGRTGTASLKEALTLLLEAPCYHMIEVFARPADAVVWRDAALGSPPDWNEFLDGYAAAVDWPAAAFWEELAAANPDAIILLSTRDPEKWWESASQTIFADRAGGPPIPGFEEMIEAILGAKKFTKNRRDKDEAIAAFNAHNERVRKTAPKNRLVEWTATDGWGPICDALKIPIPKTPFPKTNTREDWFERDRQRQAGPPKHP
jgi:hypothetical protein